MLDGQEKVLGGIHFRVTPLGFKEARRAFVRLTKAVGPALARAADGTDPANARPEDLDMGSVLEALVDRVEDSDLEWFANVFGKTTTFSRDGQKWPILREAEREVLFGGGQLMLFFEWLKFCLEVNFADFLDFVRRAKPDDALTETQSPDSTPSTSPT